MAKRVVAWFGLALVCALSGGCKSGTDDAGPISQDQLPTELAKVVCDSLGSCCSAAQHTFDSTNCGGSQAAELKLELHLPASAAVQYDAQAAGDCVAQLKTRIHCGNTAAADEIPACGRILVGTLAVGQPCAGPNECKEPGYCNSQFTPTGEEQGTCMAPGSGSDNSVTLTRGGTGAACSVSCFSDVDCQAFGPPIFQGGDPNQQPANQVACYRSDGLYCGGMGTCQSLGGIGADCTALDGCKDGLFCDGNSSRCTAPHPNGASCSNNSECQSQSCSQDTNTCASSSVTAMQCANGML